MTTDREGPGDDPEETEEFPVVRPTAELPVEDPLQDQGRAPSGSAMVPTSSSPPDGSPPPGGTALRGGTAPRAVLRPVPEGFPAPPPRPTRPNRAPARAGDTVLIPAQSNRSVIVVLAVIAVLVLVVAIGGSILVYRSLSADSRTNEGVSPVASEDVSETATEGASQPEANAADGETLQIGGVTVTAVSAESGLLEVGGPAAPRQAQGQFVVLELTVDNDTGDAVRLQNMISLQTTDGQLHQPDAMATTASAGNEQLVSYLGPGESVTAQLVFDVPVDAEPSAALFDFTLNAEAGEGTLELD